MAEGLLRNLAGNKFDVVSAGTNPKGLHPRSVEVMKEIGIDVSRQASKDLKQFLNQKFDYVITVCDRAKQQCPIFPGPSRSIGVLMIPQRRLWTKSFRHFAAYAMKFCNGCDCSY